MLYTTGTKFRKAFQNTGIDISKEERRYFSGSVGVPPFQQQVIRVKVHEWAEEIKKLSGFATSQPHSAYAAFTHGLSSKWNHLLPITDWETILDTDLPQPIEKAIRTQLIPALTGHSPPSDLVRELMTLPTSLGGLGLINPEGIATEQHERSKRISAPLVDLILQQDHQLLESHSIQKNIKEIIRAEKRTMQKDAVKNLQRQLLPSLQRCMELSQEKGASAWLSALPIDKYGFSLHKSAFRDALSLRYDWSFANSPSYCSFGHIFSVEHALSCPTGGYPSIRHNEVRDITASFMSEVCNGVVTSPHLQSLSSETISNRSSITEDQARLDIAAYGFWGDRLERTFFDLRMFNQCAQSNRQVALPSTRKEEEI